MNDIAPFPNPPIREALLDIRTDLSAGINLDILASYQESIRDRFPTKEEKFQWESGFKVEKGSAPQLLAPTGGPVGLLFKSPKEAGKVVQARLDGFTFNKLKPYDRWETFASEAKELWDLYVRIAKPVKVTRIALRYINRIEIPLPLGQFKDYLTTAPEVGPEIPNALSSFLMRLVIPNEEIQAHAVVTETIEKVADDILPLILDIDVNKRVSLVPTDQKMWDMFDQLRTYKNTIFLNSITNKTKEMFK